MMSIHAHALPISDADKELIRAQEREHDLRLRQEPSVTITLPTIGNEDNLSSIVESPCFIIRTLDLAGDETRQFDWLIPANDPVYGSCLGVHGLNAILHRFQNSLIRKGYITTRLALPPQNLATGHLTIIVIPGTLRNVAFEQRTDPRATWQNALPARSGSLLNLRDLEQALENFKRLPTVDTDIRILPAEGDKTRPGQSDLSLTWKQTRPIRVSLFADDSGFKATGRYQGGVTLASDNLWSHNELMYISTTRAMEGGSPNVRGTGSSTAHYSFPWGYWLASLTLGHTAYAQQVAGAYQTYTYSGKSAMADASLARVLYRDASRKTTARLHLWARSSSNFIDDTEVQVQRRRMGGWQADLDHRETLGRTALTFLASYRQGTGAFGSIPAPEENFGEGTSRPTVLTADIQITTPLTTTLPLTYSGIYRLQRNFTPLIPQDRFVIGNRYTVRGFDGEHILSADRGWLLRNDLGVNLGQSGAELYGGLDRGGVDGPSSKYLVGTSLTGGVLGLRGSYRALTYDVFVGCPIAKPTHFATSAQTAGFSLALSY